MCAPSLRSARRQKTGGEDGLVTVVQIPNGGGIESKDISGVSVIRLRGLVGLKAGASITTLPLPPDRTRHFLSGRFRLGDWSCLVLPVVDVVDLGRGGGDPGKRERGLAQRLRSLVTPGRVDVGHGFLSLHQIRSNGEHV
jgi:hypothetical protein